MTVPELLEALATAAAEPDEATRAAAKCRCVDELGPHAVTGDAAALEALVAALADPDSYDVGSYDPLYESVAEHAYHALVRVGAAAEHAVAAMLAHDTASGRANAAKVLQAQRPPHARATLAALVRCAADPDLEVRRAVGHALIGTAEADQLLDDPSTRLAGLVASDRVPAERIAALLADADREVRVLALDRIRHRPPVLADASVLIACLADPDPGVAREAAAALGPCAPDDPRATAALYAASQGSDRLAYAALAALAQRPADQLAAFSAELAAWFCSTATHHDEVAAVLGALGVHATPHIVDVLAHRLAALCPDDERPHHLILMALARLGAVARPALATIEGLALHPTANVREHAAVIAAHIASCGT